MQDRYELSAIEKERLADFDALMMADIPDMIEEVKAMDGICEVIDRIRKNGVIGRMEVVSR